MTPKRNLWPYGIIAVFALFIPATAGLVLLAVTHKEDLVSANYYDQEIRYQSQIDRLERTRQLGAQASVAYDAARRRICISLPAAHARRRPTGKVELYRPAEAGLDQHLELATDANGAQSIDATPLRPGLWKVRVAWTVDGKDYLLDQSVTNLAAASRP